MTILLIDDDDSFRSSLIRLLTSQGFAVEAYSDALPALVSADFTEADLILTDVSMPTSGEAFMEGLRERGITTPVIAMSGSQESLLGAQGFLFKPFRATELLDAIEGVMDQ